ncbi:hypothetical protein LAZ67_4002021 [Cordylochernes scorpioides]|uniref:Retrovirus-related Pol polyprotein from type-1 retrotransposable element R1 n=1 Tax=Cordylochernes scorpioides TaxID=51811 RepID=A0ABY6KDH4_9ARAC|nr:hypothetical protein LAZ67_4002021 [Cordylochernes scorpioides]
MRRLRWETDPTDVSDYKLIRVVSGKIRSSANLRLLEDEDGFKTRDLKETLDLILDRHFGNEVPEDEILLTTCGLVDPPFSEMEVKRTAFKFGNRKSPESDGIDNTIVKALVRMHPSLLARLFNRCLDTGTFPKVWKVARVVLLEKSGRKGNSPIDYRPLLLLACLGKVLDSQLAQRLKHWLESNELLSSSQHGFREGKSTTTALNEVLEGVEIGLNKGAWVLLVALDIDGAFNSMNWNKLMRNLMDMGFLNNLCSLVRDFLRDRRVSLSFDGLKLEELPEGARLVLYADDQFHIIEAALRAKRRRPSDRKFGKIGKTPWALKRVPWNGRGTQGSLRSGCQSGIGSPGVPTGIGTEVFTDGSKSGTNTGAGVVIFTNGELIFQESVTLRVDELVYSAELVAIREALRMCAEKNLSPDRLYSDCMSALVAINMEKGQLAHQIIQELEMISRAPDLHWVRGHSLIEEEKAALVERKRMRALRRRAQKCSENEREGKWTRYRAELAKYKKRTRKAHRGHWRAQCSRTLKDDKYGLPYKLAMEKLRNPKALKLLRKEDGSRAHDLSDTLSHILDVNFGVGHLECEDVLPRNGRMDPLFTEREVKRTAFKFGNRKSLGPDGIDNTIVKALVRRYGSLLTRLYNRCLELGRFPRAWKAARIALLEKSGKSGATAKDYRPVSLLSCLGKVMDSLLAQRLTRWLESGGHLSSSQHGFRKGLSTTTCLEGILGKIEEGVAKGNWVIEISFDIAGAFDNPNWNMVVNALDEKGCPFNLLTLIRDFLRDRRVSIEVGAVDMHRIVSKGCPQGSCCGPILWNVVADTILRKELPAGACMVAYADDNYLIISEKSRRKAEALANKSIGWIKILYAGAGATIWAGGYHTTAFLLHNGLRQGCAVSTALFSIATGPLLRRLESTIAYAIVLLIHRDKQFEQRRLRANINSQGFRFAVVVVTGVTVLWHLVLRPGKITIANINIQSLEIHVINCHLSHTPQEQNLQLKVIVEEAIRHLPTRAASYGSRVDAARLDSVLITSTYWMRHRLLDPQIPLFGPPCHPPPSGGSPFTIYAIHFRAATISVSHRES